MNEYDSICQKMQKLIRKINHYGVLVHMFYQTEYEQIYESLRHELEKLEDQYPQCIQTNTPTLQIGFCARDTNVVVERKTPMLSLKHTYNYDEAMNFIKKSLPDPIILQPKIDGIALEIVYEDQILVQASLRGNGYVGEDITLNVLMIKDIPKTLNRKGSYLIRGEIFSNDLARAEIAGTLRAKTPSSHLQALRFLAYSLLDISSTIEMMQFLEDLKYPTITYVPCYTLEDVLSSWDKLLSPPYPCDGIVIRQNQISSSQTARYPHGILAYKHTEGSTTTRVKNIEWKVSRNGILVPVAILEPIRIKDVIVGKVTCHNRNYLDLKKLGINSQITIARVGQTAPQIINVLTSGQYEEPTSCPSCLHPLEKTTLHYICSNSACQERIREKLKYFFAKLGVKGLGKQILNKIKLTSFLDGIKYLLSNDEWIQDKTDNRVKEQIANLQPTKKQILCAIGIPGVSDAYINKLPDNLTAPNNGQKDLICQEYLRSPDMECIFDFFTTTKNRNK